MRFVLVSRFTILSFLCIVGLATGMGLALSSLLTRAVSEWEWENTAAFTRHEVRLIGLDRLFTAPQDAAARERWEREIPRLFADLPEVTRVKVWDRTATVLWSDEPQLIGRRFPDNEELQAALAGRVAVEITEPSKSEHVYERAQSAELGSVPLAEIYVPILSQSAGEVVGVVEVYKTPVRLFATIRRGRLVVWAISLVGGFALYTVLLPLVRQVYGREIREQALQAHAARLEAEVAARTRDLQRQTEQFLQAQKMEAVGLLAGGVAHDFNNLLTVIIGQSQLLRKRLDPADPLHRRVRLIHETADRAAELTRQLLAFSRKQVLHAEVLDLSGVIADWGKMLRRLIGEDIELVTVAGRDLCRVKADPTQLEQVILNLAVNARDAMPQGGRLTLETANVEVPGSLAQRLGATPGRYVRLAVSDTGMGMDVDVQARIFEPFFTTKGPGKGTGLGLATVYGIVKQSDGHIAVESSLGHGARFEIYLPLVDEVLTRVHPAPALAELPGGSETVLLVEDDDGVRELAREMLCMCGYVVLEARDGADALRVSAEHAGPIGLLFTDVVMPEMGGSELAQRLHFLRPETRLLYTTGYADDIVVRHGVVEAQALLPKPYTAQALASKIREVLDSPIPSML